MNNKKKQVKKNKKVNKKKILAMLILILVLVVTIVVTILFINSKNNGNNEKNNSQRETEEVTENKHGIIDMNNTENAQIQDDIKVNISEKISETRVINGLEISGIQLMAENGISNFTAMVTNNSGEDYLGSVANIKFLNRDGSEYANLEIYIPEVKTGQINYINASTISDIINAYDLDIKL